MTESDYPILDVDTCDSNFKNEVALETGGEKIMKCYQCGTCTVSCPVREVDESYNPRRIIRMVLIGMKEDVLNSDFIWLCSECHTCAERCPQRVRIPELMNALRNIATREGYMHKSFKVQIELLKEHGRLLEIGEFENQKRQRIGLPQIEEKSELASKILKNSKLKVD